MLIRVIDLESTAFPEDGGRICQVAHVDLIGDGSQWELFRPWSRLCNPGVPIPSTASAIHHIVDADVSDCKPFGFEELFLSAVPIDYIAAHNLKAERGFLRNHLKDVQSVDRPPGIKGICTYKGAMRVWPEAPGHSNQALRYELGLDVPREFSGHRADTDVVVTAKLLQRLLSYASIDELVEWTTLPVLQVICRIGKQRGTRWEHVDSGFMFWCLDKDFDEDVLYTCQYWLDVREKAEREADDVEDDEENPVERVLSHAELEQAGQKKFF